MTDKQKLSKLLQDNPQDFKIFPQLREANNGKRSKYVSFFVDEDIALSACNQFKETDYIVVCVAIKRETFNNL